MVWTFSAYHAVLSFTRCTNSLASYAAKNQAERFVDFLNSVAPIRMKKSQELISTDIHTSIAQYKFTWSCELVPICKDDLVALPLKLARSVGNIAPLGLCFKVGVSST